MRLETVRDRIEVVYSALRGEIYVIDKATERVVFSVHDIEGKMDIADPTTDEIKDFVLDNYDEELHDLMSPIEEDINE